MTKITQTAFAAVDTTSINKNHIMSWTVSGSAGGVRRQVGKAWDAGDPKQGWHAARAEGIRVKKITISTFQ
jgi:hypothetical protein